MRSRTYGQGEIVRVAYQVLHVVRVVVHADGHLTPTTRSFDDTIVVRVVLRLPRLVIHLQTHEVLTQFVEASLLHIRYRIGILVCEKHRIIGCIRPRDTALMVVVHTQRLTVVHLRSVTLQHIDGRSGCSREQLIAVVEGVALLSIIQQHRGRCRRVST